MKAIETERASNAVAQEARAERRRRVPVVLLVAQHVAIVNGALLGTLLLGGFASRNITSYWKVGPAATLVFVGVFAYHLVYEREPYDTYTECLRVVSRATLIAAIGTFAATYALGAVAFPRSVALLGFPLILILTYLSEVVRLRHRLSRAPARRALVLGDRTTGEPIVEHFVERPTASVDVQGTLEPEQLLRRLEQGGPPPCDLVLLPGPDQLWKTPTRLLFAARRSGIRIFMLAGGPGALLGLSSLHELGGLPWHELRVQSLPLARRASKRLLDLSFVVLLSPFALVAVGAIALAVRLSGPGPVLHRQHRTGRRGRHFTILKFRTMRDPAEEGRAVLADLDDPRVTKLGRYLRRHRLDELPQLWNVLRGDMSLVGPRPERLELAASFEEAVPGYGDRHAMRPGITGLAQVLGSYDTPAEHKIRYDLLYVANWSVWLDVQILLKTAVVVMRGTGGW
ncbi:MAG: sugar transferase [Actinomycetota bacterium]